MIKFGLLLGVVVVGVVLIIAGSSAEPRSTGGLLAGIALCVVGMLAMALLAVRALNKPGPEPTAAKPTEDKPAGTPQA